MKSHVGPTWEGTPGGAGKLGFGRFHLLEDFDWADDFGCHEDFVLEDFEGDEASVEYSKY